MTTPTADSVRTFILDYAAEGLKARGLAPADVPDTFDLLAEEVVDSFGLLELIGQMERAYGVTLEFDDVDPDELTRIGAFSRFVADQVGAEGSAPELPVAAPTPAVDVRPRITELDAKAPSGLRRALGKASLGSHRGGVRARDKAFSLAVAGGFRRYGRNSVVQLPVRIVGAHRISIGSGVFIGLGAWLQVLGDGDEEAIVIGDGASFAGFSVISAVQSIRLGRNVSLARNVYIADHAHAYDDADKPVLDQGLADIGPIEIGDGAWLGENAVVLPNVRIGEGAVVGANSVVSRDIPAHSLAVGSPARVIRGFGTAS